MNEMTLDAFVRMCVGRELRWEMREAVAAAYEELQRPAPEMPDADGDQQQDDRPGLFEICPLLMLANDADWDTVRNCGVALDQMEDATQWYGLRCIKTRCAWWVRERCAVATLAMGGRE